jgi:hypothetical protein
MTTNKDNEEPITSETIDDIWKHMEIKFTDNQLRNFILVNPHMAEVLKEEVKKQELADLKSKIKIPK